MSNDNKLFELLASCIGPMPLHFVCRIYTDLSVFPSSVLPSDLRTNIIRTAVNDRFKSDYSIDQIRVLTNLIAINIYFVRDIILIEDLAHNSLTIKFNRTTVNVSNDLVLLPFTMNCVHCQQPLIFYDTKLINIIDCSKIIQAVHVMMECKHCSLVFGHSSFCSLKTRRRYVTVDSINSPKKTFYLCDSFGFTMSVLYDYSCQLMNNQAPFNAFIRTVIDRIIYEQYGNISHDLEHTYTTKVFESYWILYNIVYFELMLSNNSIVVMPDSLNRGELERYFENSSGWWYHLFSIFWSRHKTLPNIKCNLNNCSKCIIVDGHQKSKRLVCENKNVADITIDEMTSVEIGCPYAPCRKKKSNHSNNCISSFFCYSQFSNI